MGGTEKRKSAGKKAGKSDQSINANTANKARCSTQVTETLMKVPPSAVITEKLNDCLIQDADPDEFMLAEEEFPCLPETPCKSPALKQRRIADRDTTVILSQISEISRLVQNRSDALEKLVEKNSRVITEMKEEVSENTKQITGLKETIEFICTDINALKEKVTEAKTQLIQADKCVKEQERCLTLLQVESENSWASRERRRRCSS